jgi:hypothetical protein
MRAEAVRSFALVLAMAWGVPGGAGAVPIIESTAFAFSDESGEDPGSETDEEETSTPGAPAAAHALRCLGGGICAVDPTVLDSAGGHARARTEFGENHARAYGSSGPDPNSENDVVSGGSASSLWIDEWTFSGLAGQSVSIELHVEGSWQNFGRAFFEAAVADSTQPAVHNPDDPIPFLDLDHDILARVSFDSAAPFALDGVPPFFVPVPGGGNPEGGSADLTLTLRFVPVPGRLYRIGARLVTETDGEADDEGANFESTASVTRVVLPAGLSFTSAAGASWNTVVPEPGSAALLALAGAVFARSRRR